MAMDGTQMGSEVAAAILAVAGEPLSSEERAVVEARWQLICTAIVNHMITNGHALPGTFLDGEGTPLLPVSAIWSSKVDLLLNQETWDLEPTATDLQIVDGSDAVRQHLIQRLKTFLAEWVPGPAQRCSLPAADHGEESGPVGFGNRLKVGDHRDTRHR